MNKKIYLQYTTLNEPVPDFIYEDVKSFVKQSNSYHYQPEELTTLLAKKYSLSKDKIFLTAGIDEAILMFMSAYGKSAHIFPPTYIGYQEAALATGANLNTHNAVTTGAYEIDTKKISYATMIIIANPNNPFGYTPRKTIEVLIKNNPDALIVIDEAYGEFLPDHTLIPLIKKHSKLVVMRSFSKAYGMAGIRIGYVLAHPSVIEIIKNKTHLYNISYPAIGAAISALQHEDYFTDLRTELLLRKGDFEAFLIHKKFTILESKINCVIITFETPEQGKLFTEYLLSHDIIVSNGNGGANIGLDKSYVRITIGTKKEMETVMKVIGSYV